MPNFVGMTARPLFRQRLPSLNASTCPTIKTQRLKTLITVLRHFDTLDLLLNCVTLVLLGFVEIFGISCQLGCIKRCCTSFHWVLSRDAASRFIGARRWAFVPRRRRVIEISQTGAFNQKQKQCMPWSGMIFAP